MTNFQKPIKIAIIAIALLNTIQCTLLFQQTNDFGTIQLKLTTTSGFISPTTTNTFSFPNPGYTNFSSLGLALCGYDIPPTINLQFTTQLTYDDQSNSFFILILPLNGTSFYFLNYFLMITSQNAASYLSIQNVCLSPNFILTNPTAYNRTYQYNITGPFIKNSTSVITVLPFLQSINSIANTAYNYYNITNTILPNTDLVNIIVFINYSMVAQVCLSILYYYNSIASSNLFQSVSYGIGLPINSLISTQTLASVAQQNFSMSSIYGPNFTPKCVVGFQAMLLASASRQTLSFNLTGLGISNLISNTNYQLNYNWMCLANIVCPSLNQQYYPLINSCQPTCTIANCSICSTSTSCQNCSSGFFLNALYRCTSCISNCNNCTASNNCQLCSNGYFYNSTNISCTQCPLFCTTCSSGLCNACLSGYIPTGNQCLKCSSVLPQCIQCSSSTYCTLCPNNTFFSGSGTGCVNCNTSNIGCLTCGTLSNCYTCQFGYYLILGLCKTCVISQISCCPYFVTNCVTCKNQTACSVCQLGYYLSSNLTCLNCSSISNCQTCSNQTSCTVCQTNYLLISNNCWSCSTNIPFCTTCQNLTYCLVCSSPYLAVNGNCYNCPIWPLNQLYYLNQANVCISCANVTANCTRCSNSLQCTQCQDLYYLSNNTCQLCSQAITNCISCNGIASCQICTNGFYVDISNPLQCLTCNIINNCLSCTQLYYTVLESYELTCSVCELQYYINNTICSPCIQVIPFCLTCQNNYQCSLCQTSYYLSSTLTCITCQILIPGCIFCNSSSLCSDCLPGYYLSNNYCTLCSFVINNCYTCAVLNNVVTCQSCQTGYYLGLNFTCLLCNSTTPLCTSCTSSTICLTCISGYVANSNFTCTLCNKVLPFCTYCTQSLQCQKCISNYQLDAYGDCLPCSNYISGCSVCGYVLNSQANQTQLNCTQCLATYLIFNSSNNFTQCLACNQSIFYCNSCLNFNVCLNCSNISFLNSKSQCSLCSLYLQNCLSCTNSTLCVACNQGAYLMANGTCVVCSTAQFGNFTPYQYICNSCIYQGTAAICISCVSGSYLSNNNCFQCGNAMQYCQTCSSSTLCIACNNYYYLSDSNNQCLPCNPNLVNCINCFSDGTCLACDSNFYLNTTLNQCILCSISTPNCQSCNSTDICTLCNDGYYLSGVNCLSCSAAISNCVICSSGYNCLLMNAQASSSGISHLSPIIYIIIAVVCLLFAIFIAICLIKKYRENIPKQQLSRRGQLTASETERDLVSDHLTSNKTVKLTPAQRCHFCNKNAFDIMKIQLICNECSSNSNRGNAHKINNVVNRQGMKESRNRRQKNMVETVKSDADFNLEPPPPSEIHQPTEQLKIGSSDMIYSKKSLPQQQKKIGSIHKQKPDLLQLITVPKGTQSCIDNPKGDNLKNTKNKNPKGYLSHIPE